MEAAGPARLSAVGVSPREAEIFAAVGERLTNAEIADRFVISVRTVESHVSALLRKLGATDRLALARLARELAAQAEPATTPGLDSLPRPLTSFFGREADMRVLGELVAGHRLVTITGIAGCGKTRIAVEFARAWTGTATFADFAPVHEPGVAGILAASLGIAEQPEDLAAAARVALTGRDMLLVADNCEHVADSVAALLPALLRQVPGLRVLATSRQPLGVPGELPMALAPLAVPGGEGLAEVMASPACRLFGDRAQAANPGFRLDDRSAPPVAGLCRRLDGLPLAIELVAAQAGSFDLAGLSALADDLGQPSEPTSDGSRLWSLRQAIAWSWQQLDSHEHAALRRLAALPGEFPLALAELVLRPKEPPLGRAMLTALVRRSLVAANVGSGEPARYRILGVIRSSLRGGGVPQDKAESQVQLVHAEYFAGQIRALAAWLAQSGQAGSARPVFDEANSLAALTWSAANCRPLTVQLLRDLGQILEFYPSRAAINVVCEVATGMAEPDAEGLAHAAIAASYLSLERAGQLAGLSVKAASTQRDHAVAALACGWERAYRHDESAALDYLQDVIGFATEAGDRALEGAAWQGLGVARSSSADSRRDWLRAVAAYARAGDLAHANNVRYMLASDAVDAESDLTEVPVWLDGCEAFASRMQFSHELAHIRRVRSEYERIQGRLPEARRLLDEVIGVFRAAGDIRCLVRSLLELARFHLSGRPDMATTILLDALTAAVLGGDASLQSRVLSVLAVTADAAGDVPLAARALGALDSLPAERSRSGPRVPAIPPDLRRRLLEPPAQIYAEEGRAGGPSLLLAMYESAAETGP
jgi:predicted ATPase/DNA-binding CsgD family transcriptional regulator